MFDEEAIRAERLLRIKTAVRHLVFKLERKACHGFFHPQLVAVLGADRADRAGEECLIGLMSMPLIGRLSGDRRELTDFLKARRRQLSAGIAINTGRIDVEVTCDIGVESFFLISHCAASRR